MNSALADPKLRHAGGTDHLHNCWFDRIGSLTLQFANDYLPNNDMKPCQALVIEDDRELGELILEVLAMELDCDVKLIQDGSQALAWLSSDLARVHIPTLIVLDVHLPGASGLEILELLRSMEEYRNACIVMSSSDSILLDRARGKADLLVLKPVAYSHFIEICRWFRTSVDIGIDCRKTVESVRL